MKMKSLALLAIPSLLAAFFVYMSPAFAEDPADVADNNSSSFQTLADSGVQNQDMNNTDNNNNNNNSSMNSNNNSSSSSTSTDEGSPDTASSTGDDDY